MAKIYEQFQYCLIKKLTQIYLEVSIGAAGAPTLVSGNGISGIVRDSAGVYTVTFTEIFPKFIMAKIMQLAAASEDLAFQLLDVDLVAKTIQFSCKDSAAAETDPSNGSSLFIELSFSQSTL